MKYSNRHISDEELDQLFRDAHAAEGKESLFVPEFWSEMEAMLPPVKQSRSFAPWIYLAASVTLTLLILFYPSGNTDISLLPRQVSGNPGSNSGKNPAEELVVENTPSLQNTGNQETAPGFSDGAIHRRNQIKPGTNRQPDVNDPDVQGHVALNGEKDGSQFQLTSNDSQNNSPELPGEDLSFDPLGRRSILEGEYMSKYPLRTRVIDENRNENEWYLELGPTIGQSPYLSADQKRNIVAGAVLGGGYTVRIDRSSVSFGLQARMEGFGGLTYQETNFAPNIMRTVSVKQLYSIEMPLKFGYQLGRSEIHFGVVPGIQLFVHGKEQIIENQVVQRTGNYTGKVEHSNSLTMEFGMQYYYRLSPNYSIGAKLNADVLRPFHTDYYLGKLSGFPLNGQLVLRRTFTL